MSVTSSRFRERMAWCLIVGEFATAVALSGLAFFLNGMMWVNDVELYVPTFSWQHEATARFVATLPPTIIWAGLVWVVNKRVIAALLGWPSKRAVAVTCAAVGLVLAGSAVGALFLVVWRPIY